jgi:hypothetical protein
VTHEVTTRRLRGIRSARPTLALLSHVSLFLNHLSPHGLFVSYLMMIIGIYARLGVFLLMVSCDPDAQEEHNLVHCVVERGTRSNHGLAGTSDEAERGHLLGDVPTLFLIAILLGVLMQMGSSNRVTTATATR